nr:MAG TPA: hypothetical protein [Bacteriophage sp.]
MRSRAGDNAPFLKISDRRDGVGSCRNSDACA